jgi:signal transduction histidine kinase
MTLAKLVLEIRRRAASFPQDLPQPMAIEQAAREVLQTAAPGEELDASRQILAALLGIGAGEDFDAAMLDALTPEVILRLDALLEDLLQFGRRDEAVRALRAAVIHGLK